MRKIFIAALATVLIPLQASFADSARTTLATAERHFLEGRYEIVINESQSLINSGSGKKDELYYLKGLSELKAGRLANARGSFSYIISNYPRSKKAFDARLGLGDAYFLEGDTAKALSVYSDIAGRYVTDKNVALVYARLSSCYAKMGYSDKASYYYDMVRKASPLGFEGKAAPVVSEPPKSVVSNNAATVNTGAGAFKYSVQIGSFKDKRNADRLAKKLSGRGYKSYVELPLSSWDKFYRVKIGELGSKNEALNMTAKLKSDGYRTKLCTDEACE